MIIYSARHGETVWNSLNRISGITDIELTANGIEQAKTLAQKIVSECEDIGAIICSPMKRAQKTAFFAAEALGLDIVTDERLREWNYGSFEGMNRDTPGYSEAKLEFGCRMPGGGESVFELAARVYGLLGEVIEKYNGKNVLLVSHGGVCRIIDSYFHDMTIERFAGFFMRNCELLSYKIERN